jgi:four helix bundle protein
VEEWRSGGVEEWRSGGEMASGIVLRHQDLDLYKKAFEGAMRIFELTKSFPKEETYSLTDQIRRSSRSVCANIAEAWRKRRYEAAFVSKLNDSESEAAETQTWLEFAVKCGYLDKEIGRSLFIEYDEIISMLVSMMQKRGMWVLPSGRKETRT